jgi:hypothetical protein
MPNHMDKKNGKKKVLPVLPPSSRRGGATVKTIQDVTKKLQPNEVKLVKKIITKPTFRKQLGNALLTGLTFGLFNPNII